jgi:hypothetical protein
VEKWKTVIQISANKEVTGLLHNQHLWKCCI